MNITIIGTGYVGLTSGTCLAEVGNSVMCLDTDHKKIEALKNGQIPIYEPGLEAMVLKNAAAGRLHFTTDIEEAVRHGDVQFIAVGTPPDEDGSADLQHVLAAARQIGRYATHYKVVVNKSTVPVGTALKVRDAVSDELIRRDVDVEFTVVSNPEFLKEGAAIEDFMRPDRIVVGVDDSKGLEVMKAIYAPFQRNHERLVITDVKSAEFTKYAANAMLATRISFMNELANLAESIGADIEMVRRGIGSDPRIGYDFLYAGCGYGGSCFPKDVKALIQMANDDGGTELKILSAVEAVNESQKHVITTKIKAHFGELIGRHFAMWGLAFKPNTDDMRDAPSRAIIEDLWKCGASVTAYDPVAMPAANRIYGTDDRLKFAASPLAALVGADALIIVTEWKEFRTPEWSAVKERLKTPTVFDGRNLYEPKTLKDAGLTYFTIGRGA